MDTIYPATLVSALVVSVLLQMLKNSVWFPFVSRNTNRINATISIVAAFVVQVGLIYSLDYDDNSGNFVFYMHGNVWDIVHTIQHTIGQWAVQQAAYKGLIVPPETLGEIRAMLARMTEPPPVSEGESKAQHGR